MILSPAVLAGAGASILMPIVKSMASLFGSDDPEELVYEKAYEYFGDTGEEFARTGLFGMLGMNLKGSLGIDIGVGAVPSNFVELFGAPVSVIDDEVQAVQFARKGDWLRAAEKALPLAGTNIVKAIREGTQGVTKTSGAPIFYGTEQIVPTFAESVTRALGFSPSRISSIREKQWNEEKIVQRYGEVKHDIYAKLIKFMTLPAEERTKDRYADILADIMEFNKSTEDIRNLVSPITPQSIKATVKRAMRPSRRERLRQ